MGLLELGYRTLMRRNSVYIAFICGGAIAGEYAFDYTFDNLWKWNNKGKLYEDLLGSVIGGVKEED